MAQVLGDTWGWQVQREHTVRQESTRQTHETVGETGGGVGGLRLVPGRKAGQRGG